MSESPSPTAADHEVTRLLVAWNQGSAGAAEQLTELVYAQVRAIAGKHLRQFDGDVTLAPTELANELFLRLLGKDIDWRDRRHFFGVVVAAMRNLLIDMARARGSEKRGGGQIHVTLSSAEDQPSEPREQDQLNSALNALRELDARSAKSSNSRISSDSSAKRSPRRSTSRSRRSIANCASRAPGSRNASKHERALAAPAGTVRRADGTHRRGTRELARAAVRSG